MGFIDEMRAEGHAVESTCRVLREQGCPVAARTYRAWRRGRPPADRTVSDAVITDAILATAGTPEELYGRRKMTHHLRRTGHQVAFCTVDRLMRGLGRTGIRRGKGVRTTISAKDADRPGDLLQRQFRAEAPNRVWVADFSYVRTWAGFSYVAFIVDEDVCTRCALCVDRCPTGVIILGKLSQQIAEGDPHTRTDRHGYAYGVRF